MFVYLQKLLHCLIINYTRQIHRFHRVHEICDQSNLAILNLCILHSFRDLRRFMSMVLTKNCFILTPYNSNFLLTTTFLFCHFFQKFPPQSPLLKISGSTPASLEYLTQTEILREGER